MEVSIIIPNYNGEGLLRKNLPRVIAAKKNLRNKIKEIIVVDDASKDKSVHVLKKEFPEVRTIKHRVNRGFSASVNTGARSSKGELLALLNTDVFPEKDFLKSVHPHFKSRYTFGVSLHEVGRGGAKGRFKNGFIVHEPSKEGNEAEETFWVSGGSGVFRRTIWMELGGLDERLFSPFYWEDVDISYRALKRGYKLFWEPRALVHHQPESTIKKTSKRFRERIQERNQLIFIWKNLTSPNLFKKHIAGLTKRTARHPGYLIIMLMAFTKIRLVLKKRKKEKRECKVSDEAIFASFK
jgi:GT2 family glycosyltransferase